MPRVDQFKSYKPTTSWRARLHEVIFEADTEAKAKEFMENDPFVRDGLFNAALHPFRAALVREP